MIAISIRFETVTLQINSSSLEIKSNPWIFFTNCVPIWIPSIICDLMTLIPAITWSCDYNDSFLMNIASTFFSQMTNDTFEMSRPYFLTTAEGWLSVAKTLLCVLLKIPQLHIVVKPCPACLKLFNVCFFRNRKRNVPELILWGAYFLWNVFVTGFPINWYSISWDKALSQLCFHRYSRSIGELWNSLLSIDRTSHEVAITFHKWNYYWGGASVAEEIVESVEPFLSLDHYSHVQ